jgi:ankyrin repeat protein
MNFKAEYFIHYLKEKEMELPEENPRHQKPAELQAKWGAEDELNAARARNLRTATLAGLLAQDNQTLLQILQEIMPMDQQEMQLQHDIEYLTMEKNLLSDYLDINNTSFDIEALKAKYLKELAELKDIFLSGFRERLKSRPSILIDGKLTVLDKSLINELTNQLQGAVEEKLKQLQENFMAILSKPAITLFTHQVEVQQLLEAKNTEIRKLIDKKTEKGERYNAIQEEMADKAENYLSSLPQETDFPQLCFRGKKTEVDGLLKKNKTLATQPNSSGELPLHRACEGGQLEIVKLLIDKGANPSISDERKGLSAFHYTCMQGNMELVEYLYNKYKEKGFKTLARNGSNVLYSAVMVDNLAVASWIINKKLFDLDLLQGLVGETVLHLAARMGYPKMIHLFISAGAKPHLLNGLKDTAPYQALLYRRTSALIAFMENGYCLSKVDLQQIANYLPQKDERYEDNLHLWRSCIEAAQCIYMLEVSPTALSFLQGQASTDAQLSGLLGIYKVKPHVGTVTSMSTLQDNEKKEKGKVLSDVSEFKK